MKLNDSPSQRRIRAVAENNGWSITERQVGGWWIQRPSSGSNRYADVQFDVRGSIVYVTTPGQIWPRRSPHKLDRLLGYLTREPTEDTES